MLQEGRVVQYLGLEGCNNRQVHLSIELVGQDLLVVVEVNETHVCIPLHGILALLAKELLEFTHAIGGLQTLMLLELKG